MKLGKVYDEFFFHNTKDGATQYRAPDCSNAADHGHEKNGNPRLKSKDAACAAARINENRVTRMDGACHPCQSSSNRMCPELEVVRIHA